MLQHRAICLIGEANILITNNRLKICYLFWIIRIANITFRIKYLIYSLQRSHTTAYAIGGFAKVFGGIDNGIENHKVIDECRGINRRMFTQNQRTTKPQENGDECRTKELRHRVRQIIAAIDTVESGSCGIDKIEETHCQFVLCIKRLYHAQTAQCLIYLGEYLGILLLSFGRCAFERTTNTPNQQPRYGQ